MQAVEGSTKYGFSMYVTGFLVLVGLLCGRFICGWLCPFGWIQELLHKLPFKKIKVPAGLNRILSYFKYLVLALFVIILPIVTVDEFGISTPFFCKYICPAGTLEAGIPLLIINPMLRGAVGFLFSWKMVILLAVILFSMMIFRPFCRYICPLGAFYGLFNGISIYRYRVDSDKCTKCGVCTGACQMDITPFKTPNSAECIRCGECVKACPHGAICGGFKKK